MNSYAELRRTAQERLSTAEGHSAVLAGILEGYSIVYLQDIKNFVGRYARGKQGTPSEYDTEYTRLLNEYVRLRRLQTIYQRKAERDYDYSQNMSICWGNRAESVDDWDRLSRDHKLKAKALRKAAREQIRAEMEFSC